jgi:hypothetical protein
MTGMLVNDNAFVTKKEYIARTIQGQFALRLEIVS